MPLTVTYYFYVYRKAIELLTHWFIFVWLRIQKKNLPQRMQTILIEIFIDFFMFSTQMLCNLKMRKD
jgi:hypothetical protein